MTYYPKSLINHMYKSRKYILPSIKNTIGSNKNTQICLIGFQGSKHKQLSKYVDIYQKRNMPTLTYTPGYFENYNPKYVNAAAVEIAEQLIEKEKKIVFHVISGGCYPLYLTLSNIIKTGNKDKIDKIIFDSSPVKCTICSATRALSIKLSLPPIIVESILKIYYFKVKLPIYEWCYDFYSFMGSSDLDNIPKLFISSDIDQIVPLDDVKEFLTGQNNYKHIIFKDAEHTKNILKDNKLYVDSVNDFLDNK